MVSFSLKMQPTAYQGFIYIKNIKGCFPLLTVLKKMIITFYAADLGNSYIGIAS
jgi:hypothetical protein